MRPFIVSILMGASIPLSASAATVGQSSFLITCHSFANAQSPFLLPESGIGLIIQEDPPVFFGPYFRARVFRFEQAPASETMIASFKVDSLDRTYFSVARDFRLKFETRVITTCPSESSCPPAGYVSTVSFVTSAGARVEQVYCEGTDLQ